MYLVALIGFLHLAILVSGMENLIFNGLDIIRDRRQSEKPGCVLPPHPEHGQWKLFLGEASPGEMVSVNSIIKYECDVGYKSPGNVFVICDGKWNKKKFPECDALCPPLYSSATYYLKCIDKMGVARNCSEATHGTYLQYTCAPFYETPVGYKRALLCDEGKWSQKPTCQPVCGTKIPETQLIIGSGARPNERLESPWVTALYSKENDSWEYICGGSIVSLTVVLTAAHCVSNEYGAALPEDNFLIGAGKLFRKYQAPGDTRAQYLEIYKIIVHDDYKGSSRRFLADIAVLVTRGEFLLTEVVQPVCFYNIGSVYLYPGNVGEVSSWGVAEGDLPSDVLRTLEIPHKHETHAVTNYLPIGPTDTT